MAEKNTGGVRLDDFVAAVHADPAKVEPKTLLSGFVGRGEEDGKIRIYSDPALSQWVEASADDVVHSRPIEGSALGGSHVWLKSDAQLKAGSAAPAAAAQAAGAVGGIGADTGVFNPYTIHPTLWTQIGCPPQPTAATLCTISPCGHPTYNTAGCHTITTLCTQVPPCPTPTHFTRCATISIQECPPFNTTATLCTHAPACFHTREFICPPPVTQQVCPTHNFICVASGGFACPPPQTINENPALQQHVMAAALPPTQMYGCGPHTQVPNCAPTSMFGCGTHTQVPNCAPTNMPGCGPHTQVPNCAPTAPLGCGPHTHVPNCAPTALLGCGPHTQVPNCAPTHLMGCPGTSTCPPQGGAYPTMPQQCLPRTLPSLCC